MKVKYTASLSGLGQNFITIVKFIVIATLEFFPVELKTLTEKKCFLGDLDITLRTKQLLTLSFYLPPH